MATEQTVSELVIRAREEGVSAVAREMDKLAGSEKELVRGMKDSERVRENASSGLERIARAYDKTYRLTKEVERDERAVTRAREAGLAGTQAYERAVAALAKRQEELSRITNDNAKGAGLARHEWINLSRQLQDVGVSLYGGMSPMTVLAQQGGQIADVFSSSGAGAGAALKSFGATVAGYVLSPVTLFAAGAGAAVLASMRWKEATDALTYSLNGLGRQSGMTVSQLNRVAEGAGARSGISNASARELAGQFASAGVSGGSIGSAIEMTRGLSRGLGVELDAMGKELASALADPAKGADELARKYGLVTFSEREHIKELAAMGDKAGATAKLVAVLAEQISKMQVPTTAWGRIMEGISKRVSDKWDKLGQELEGAKTFKQMFDPIRKASEDAKRAAEEQAAVRAKEISQMREDSAFAIRQIQARSYAEREAVAMEKARVDTLRQTNDAVKANIAAEAERARMQAEAARKVDELTRSTADNARLARMSPFERKMAEIDISERNFRRDIVPDAATPMAAEFNTAGNAARQLADALTQSAGRIGRLVPLSEWQDNSSDLARAREAIAAVESRGSGDYGARGPLTKKGDRAYGRYQVMGENVGPWTEDALGRRMTPNEFLNDPAAQDAVFNRQFGKSLMKYGNMDDAASVWFTGRPLSRGGGARDVLGTTGTEYVRRFNSELGGKATTADSLDAQTTRAFDEQRSIAKFEAIDRALQGTNAEIGRQRDLLRAQDDAFGKSTEEVSRAAKAQELLNQFQSQGVPITDDLRSGIEATAYNYGELARETEELANKHRQLVENMDFVRGSARDAIGGLASGLMNGKRAADALLDSLKRIADRLISMAAERAVEGLFGKTGQAGGGFFSFADGGVMTSAGPLPLRAYAGGGVANSPQMALFGEGSRPEAFVPLPDGRRIPVAMQGGGNAQPAPVTVNLIGAPAGAKVKDQTAPNGARRVDVIFDERAAAAMSSPEGAMAMRNTYGMAPKIARR